MKGTSGIHPFEIFATAENKNKKANTPRIDHEILFLEESEIFICSLFELLEAKIVFHINEIKFIFFNNE